MYKLFYVTEVASDTDFICVLCVDNSMLQFQEIAAFLYSSHNLAYLTKS